MDVALLAVVALAFVVEAALGFGATLVTVTIGAFFLDIGPLLVAFVPLNLMMSIVLVGRAPREVDRALLFRTVLPLMALGLPLGMLASKQVDSSILKRVFGALVIVLAVSALRARDDGSDPHTTSLKDRVLLLVGGIVHGAFATGGPMAVYVIGKHIVEKGPFRATLSGLWLVLNLVLVVSYVIDGSMTRETLLVSLKLAGALLVGLVVGEVLHRRVPTLVFKRLVWVLLACGGLALLVRG